MKNSMRAKGWALNNIANHGMQVRVNVGKFGYLLALLVICI